MNDSTPEITEEQRRAWIAVACTHPGSAKVLADLLPNELTNPPKWPTEPGLYLDKRGEYGSVWRLETDGTMGQVGGDLIPSLSLAPFTRLVPEREPITRVQIFDRLNVPNTSNYTKAEAILALVNG